ncbi:MAG TPA: hypothetical protein VHE79_05060 [Spirochaetia bacterium]
MKEPLKLPFIFLFMLVCVTLVCAALNVLATWGTFDAGLRPFTLGYAVRMFPRSVFDVMIPSTVLAIVLLGFRMARHPFSRLLGLLIVLIAGYVVLVNGMIWFRSLAASTPRSTEAPAQYVRSSALLRMGDRVVYAGGVREGEFSDLLVLDTTRTANRLTVYPRGTIASRGGVVTFTPTGTAALSGRPERAASALFTPDRFTVSLLRDVGTLTADFERLLSGRMAEFFAACFSLVFLCAASLMLLRVTRWPLLNIMILLIATRGYFALYHLLGVTLAPRIAAVIPDALAARLAPSAAFVVIGIVLLLVDIIFIPGDRWTAEGRA